MAEAVCQKKKRKTKTKKRESHESLLPEIVKRREDPPALSVQTRESGNRTETPVLDSETSTPRLEQTRAGSQVSPERQCNPSSSTAAKDVSTESVRDSSEQIYTPSASTHIDSHSDTAEQLLTDNTPVTEMNELTVSSKQDETKSTTSSEEAGVSNMQHEDIDNGSSRSVIGATKETAASEENNTTEVQQHQHLYPDLSEQLADFMKSLEKAKDETVAQQEVISTDSGRTASPKPSEKPLASVENQEPPTQMPDETVASQLSEWNKAPPMQESEQTIAPTIQESEQTAPPFQMLETATAPPIQEAEKTIAPATQVSEQTTVPPVPMLDTATAPPIQEAEKTATAPSTQESEQTTVPPIEMLETATAPPIQVSEQTTAPPIQMLETATAPPIQEVEKTVAPPPVIECATAPPDEETEEPPVLPVEVVEKRRAHQALTLEQLNSLYYNPQLAKNATLIDIFVQQEMKKDGHEFHEILLSYQRARRNLLQCEAAVDTLEANYHQLQQQVWIFTDQSVTVKGTCGDNAKCTATHKYVQCQLDSSALDNMKKALEGIQEQLRDRLSLHSYSAQMSRLQVESYIHTLLMASPDLRDMPQHSPVYACERQHPDTAHQCDRLKDCITILFGFHRLPSTDEEFIKNLQGWTERLVSVLLRVGTFEDHLFVLNHIVRCPAGVSMWASALVQVPAIPSNEDVVPLSFGNLYLDHLMTCLATLLIPPLGREEFLCHMKKCFTPLDTDRKEIAWIMVDSDGEEDEDPQHAWLYLHENDVVSVLKQLSLAEIFRHIFFITKFRDRCEYDVEKTSETTMYRVFAFCTCLVRVLGCGLATYNMSRYRQLNKRLGRSIRQTVQYVSDHWENFKDHNQGVISPESISKLQAEFDAFFMRAVSCIHMAKRLGSWQFIADMPFSNISKETMWQLLWLLHQSHGEAVDLSAVPSVEQCMDFINDPRSRGQLADILQRVPVSEGIYLLNSMTNMTECCTSANTNLILAVTMSVFEVGYLCADTRELWSKMGRELLSSVIISHPFMLSVLTQRVHEYMDRLGPMALYLYKGLPLDTWLPSDPDLVIVRQWLLTSQLGHPTNQLAQVILTKINWGNSPKGERLMVPWRVHKQVSVLAVEAYQRFILGKHLGSVIMEGVKQMTAVVHQQQSSAQEFNSWCWDLLLKLSLHRSSLPKDDQRLAAAQGDPPDLHKDDSLLPLVRGVQEKSAAACCVALMLTNYGHNVGDFLTEGIPLMQVLADQGLFKAVLCIVSYTFPMFLDNHQYLLDNERYLGILQLVLQADESYFKVVKGFLSYDFPGPITKLLTCMITSLVADAERVGTDRVTSILSLWTKLILKIPKCFQDRNCCCVLNTVIEAGFKHPVALEAVQKVLQDEYQQFCQQTKQHGVMSAIVTWVTSGITQPSFMDKSSFPEFPWLAYVVLSLEGQLESQTRLWSTIQEELLSNPKLTTDQALKKAVMHLKLEQAPTYDRLNIYRWAQQALDTPTSHPAAVLLWQRFFLLFLGRMTAHASLPQRASVGEKFFSSMSYNSMLKKMKKKLGQIVDFHLKQTAQTPTEEHDDDDQMVVSTPSDDVNRQLQYKLTRLFQTFQLWLDEPRLHDATLYLPSLPPQYEAEKLLVIFQNQSDPWVDLLDMKTIDEELVSMAAEWKTSSTPEQNTRPADASNKQREMATNLSPTERILSRLKRHDDTLPPPPVQPLTPPVPDISSSIVGERAAILHLLEADLNMLKNYADKFFSRMAQHASVDHLYLELVPHLYRNIEKQVVVSLQCTSLINPLHRCSSPGSSTIKVSERQEDIIVVRQANENRAEYKQLMVEGRMPPAKSVVTSAVHTENAITMLVKLYRSCTDVGRLQQYNEIACRLFFHLGETITPSVEQYPPTKQFFSSCIDVLGQEFVQKDANQTGHVLKMALARPQLAGMLAPHFVPGVSPTLFVSMYENLMKALQKGNPGLTFMLLTKFDLAGWLTEYQPRNVEVKQFIDVLIQALISCGTEPDDQHQLVFEVYTRHQKILLQHQFPLYLSEVVEAVLHGSSVQKLSVKCWDVLHKQCFHGNRSRDVETVGDIHVSPKLHEVYTNLSTEQVRNLLHWLGQDFMQKRTSQKEAMTFGLYSKWKLYVPNVASFVRDLCKCLVDKMMPSLTETPTIECVESVWHQVTAGFAPWIQPLFPPVGASQPWIEADKEHAAHMVKALCQVVEFAHYRTEGVRVKFYNDFITLLWLYFASVLCKPEVTSDVVAVYNLEFSQLPWEQLQPNMVVMETMAQLKEHGSGLGFNLVADIVAVVDWNRAIQVSETYYPPDQQARFQGCLFLLLIQAYAEGKHVENPDMEHLLTQAEMYNWQRLSPDSFRSACSYFLQGCEPKSLLAERTSPEAIGLRLLKSASGFNTAASAMLTPETSVKRLNYLHAICQLVCQCTYLTDCDTDLLSKVLINLLTEIETVENAVVDSVAQRDETQDMLKEIFNLLNNSNPDNDSTQVVMATIISWLQGSPQTLLLLPCIYTATRSLASLSHMVQIVEECIQLHFLSGKQDAAEPWSQVLAPLQIPELNLSDFVGVCLSEGGYLLLHCYILQRLPLCQSLSDEQKLIELLLDWTEKAKPSAEQESKMFLWWYRALMLILRQLDFGQPQGICIFLVKKLAHYTQQLGEERASVGLLGAIGLGKKSVLTERFRLSCRALTAFCSSQVVSDSQLRLQSHDQPTTTSLSKQHLATLLSLKTNKKYQPIRSEVDLLCDFVQDHTKSMRDVVQLMALITGRLYPEKQFLCSIKQ